MARGAVIQNLGNRKVTIMDFKYWSVHRRHYDQIHFQCQETEQDGANPENLDSDEQNERQRFMPYILKPSVVPLSVTPIPVTSEEGPSAPMTRQATDARVPLNEPARSIAALVLQVPAKNVPALRSRTIPRRSDPGVEVPNISERCHGPDLPTNNEC